MTQRIYIDSDEWYPVYSFDTDDPWGNPGRDVTDEEFARLKRAFDEFDWAQDLLASKAKSHQPSPDSEPRG